MTVAAHLYTIYYAQLRTDVPEYRGAPLIRYVISGIRYITVRAIGEVSSTIDYSPRLLQGGEHYHNELMVRKQVQGIRTGCEKS